MWEAGGDSIYILLQAPRISLGRRLPLKRVPRRRKENIRDPILPLFEGREREREFHIILK
jgi:hypothetical protein